MPTINGHNVVAGANLTGADISNGDLTGVNLTGCNFTNANLTNCNFTGANLTNVTFTGATVSGLKPANGFGVTMPSNYFISNGYIIGSGVSTPLNYVLTNTNYSALNPDNSSTYGILQLDKKLPFSENYGLMSNRNADSQKGDSYVYKKVNGVWTKGDLISTPDTNDYYFAVDSYIDDNYAYFTSRNRLYIYTNNNGTLTHLGNTWADSSLFNNGAVMGKKSDGSYYSSTFCHIEVFGDSFLFVRYQNSATATGQVNEIHYFKRNSGQNVWVKQTTPTDASHPFKNIYSYTEGYYPSMTLNNDYIVIGDRMHSTGQGRLYVLKSSDLSLIATVDKPGTSEDGARFSTIISLSTNNYLAVSAPYADHHAANAGGIYVFKISGETCTYLDIGGDNKGLRPNTTIQANDYIGWGVDSFHDGTDDYIAFSSRDSQDQMNSGNNDGAVFLFKRVSDTNWTLLQRIKTDNSIALITSGDSEIGRNGIKMTNRNLFAALNSGGTGGQADSVFAYNFLEGLSPEPNTSQTSKTFTNKNFTNFNLTGVDFSGSTFSNCQFINMNCTNGKLSNVNLSNADLSGSIFKNVDFTNTNLTNAKLDHCNIEGTTLTNCTLTGVDLSGVTAAKDITPANGDGVTIPGNYYLSRGYLLNTDRTVKPLQPPTIQVYRTNGSTNPYDMITDLAQHYKHCAAYGDYLAVYGNNGGNGLANLYIYKIDDVNSTLTLKQTITGLDSMSLNSGTYSVYGQVKFISNTELIIPMYKSPNYTYLKYTRSGETWTRDVTFLRTGNPSSPSYLEGSSFGYPHEYDVSDNLMVGKVSGNTIQCYQKLTYTSGAYTGEVYWGNANPSSIGTDAYKPTLSSDGNYMAYRKHGTGNYNIIFYKRKSTNDGWELYSSGNNFYGSTNRYAYDLVRGDDNDFFQYYKKDSKFYVDVYENNGSAYTNTKTIEIPNVTNTHSRLMYGNNGGFKHLVTVSQNDSNVYTKINIIKKTGSTWDYLRSYEISLENNRRIDYSWNLNAVKKYMTYVDETSSNTEMSNIKLFNLFGQQSYHPALYNGVPIVPGADISNSNFRYQNFSNVNMSGCNLNGCDFRNANLSTANMKNAFGANITSSFTTFPSGITVTGRLLNGTGITYNGLDLTNARIGAVSNSIISQITVIKPLNGDGVELPFGHVVSKGKIVNSSSVITVFNDTPVKQTAIKKVNDEIGGVSVLNDANIGHYSGNASFHVLGDYAVMASRISNVVWIFKNTSGTWSIDTTITNSDKWYGCSAKLYSDYLFVTNGFDGTTRPNCYIYKRTGSTWSTTPIQTIVFQGTTTSSRSTSYLCVKDDGSFVWHDRYTQYVYHKSGETWSYSHTLTRTASNYNSINNNLSFGGDYFASGNLGFYPSGNSASNIGAVFLYYIKNSTTWNYTRIDHPVAANGQHYQFGVSVSINNDILATCAAVERKIYIYSLSNDGNNATATSLTTIEGPTGTQYKYGYTISFVNNYLITGYQGTDGKILFYEKENDSTWTEDTSKTISAPTGDFSSPLFGKYSYGKGSTLITGIEGQGILFYNIASQIPAPQSSQVGKSFVDQNFSNCNFKGVDFSGATFTNCDFTGTVLSESSLKYITSSGITPTNGKGVSLPSGYYITKGFLVGPNITTPTVGGNPLDPLPATTPNKTFSGTIENMNLSFINFTGSSLAGVELSGNVFSNTTFSDLSGVYLNNQDLTGAVLSSANMQNVKSNNVSPPSGNGITLPPGYFVSKGFVFGPGVDTTGHPSAASASNFASESYQTTANSISSSQTSGNYPWMIQYEKNTGTIIVSDKASLTNDGTTANGGTYYDSTPTTYRYKKKSRIFSYENGKDFITTDLSNVAMEECHNTVLSYVNSGKMTLFSHRQYRGIIGLDDSVIKIRHYSSTNTDGSLKFADPVTTFTIPFSSSDATLYMAPYVHNGKSCCIVSQRVIDFNGWNGKKVASGVVYILEEQANGTFIAKNMTGNASHDPYFIGFKVNNSDMCDHTDTGLQSSFFKSFNDVSTTISNLSLTGDDAFHNFGEVIKINDNNVMAFLNGGVGRYTSGTGSQENKITVYLYNKHSGDCGWDAPIKAVEILQYYDSSPANSPGSSYFNLIQDVKRFKCNMEMTNTHLIIGKTLEDNYTSGVIVYKLNYSGSAVTGMSQVATYSNYGSVAINDNYFLIGNGTTTVKGYKIESNDTFTNIINFTENTTGSANGFGRGLVLDGSDNAIIFANKTGTALYKYELISLGGVVDSGGTFFYPGINFSDTDLTGVNFGDADLSGATFNSGTNLTNANLSFTKNLRYSTSSGLVNTTGMVLPSNIDLVDGAFVFNPTAPAPSGSTAVFTTAQATTFVEDAIGTEEEIAVMSTAELRPKRIKELRKLVTTKAQTTKLSAKKLFNSEEMTTKGINENTEIKIIKANNASITEARANRVSMKSGETSTDSEVIYAPLENIGEFVAFDVSPTETVIFEKYQIEPDNRYRVYENDSLVPTKTNFTDDDVYEFGTIDAGTSKFIFGSVTGLTTVDSSNNVTIKIQSHSFNNGNVLLVLEGFVVTAQQTLLPDITGNVRSFSGDAVALYDISLSDINGVFVFTTDAIDVDDVLANDISYNTISTNWDPSNRIAFSDAVVTKNKLGPYPNTTIKEDIVRHQAQEIFGSYVAVDIFSNESALKNEVVTKDAGFRTQIRNLLAASGVKTDADTGTDNYTRELLLQLASVHVDRIKEALQDLLKDNIVVTYAGGKFVLDGVSAPTLSLQRGFTYTFDLSDASNTGHHFKLYADTSKTDISQSVFEAGGTPGQVGAFYKVTFGNASVNPIYYDCSSSHTGEGGTINLTAAPASSANIPIPFRVGDKLAIKLRYDFPDSSGLNLVKSQPDSREYIAMLNIT